MRSSLALLRVHVLVVELPGRPLLRLRAEAAVRARGWVVVRESEDADLVLVCGNPAPEVVEAVDALWSRVPVPRARRTVKTAEDLAEALDSAARVLADDDLQARSAPSAPPPAAVAASVRLGPLGPDWPSGLIVEYALDGADRVAATGVRRMAPEQEEAPGAFVPTVAAAARLLRLVGWPALALRLDAVVDAALGGTAPERLRGRLRGVARAVERSITLRWVLDREGTGVDVTTRVLALLGAAVEGVPPPAAPPLRLLGRPVGVLPLAVAVAQEVLPRG